MVNAGLAATISRLILTRNGPRNKTDFEIWELGTNQTPCRTVGGKITSQPRPRSRQFWCQVNRRRRVHSGVYLQHSDSDSINTIHPLSDRLPAASSQRCRWLVARPYRPRFAYRARAGSRSFPPWCILQPVVFVVPVLIRLTHNRASVHPFIFSACRH